MIASMPEVTAELDALALHLSAVGFDHVIKETYDGQGFTLFARRRSRLRATTETMLRDACLNAARGESFTRGNRRGPTRDLRIRVSTIARRLMNESPRTVAHMLRQRGMRLLVIGGATWVLRDEAWSRFVATAQTRTPVRTPVA